MLERLRRKGPPSLVSGECSLPLRTSEFSDSVSHCRKVVHPASSRGLSCARWVSVSALALMTGIDSCGMSAVAMKVI